MKVPKEFSPLETDGAWDLYTPTPGVQVITYSAAELGLLLVLEKDSAKGLLGKIAGANADPAALSQAFQIPGGPKLEYDIQSPKNRWVMSAADGMPLDRDFDVWPLIELAD